MCFSTRARVCVKGGKKKRPIKEQRGQVCSYCFSSSPWKPWPAFELMINNELHGCVCVCVCKYMKGEGANQNVRGSICAPVHGIQGHQRGNIGKGGRKNEHDNRREKTPLSQHSNELTALCSELTGRVP